MGPVRPREVTALVTGGCKNIGYAISRELRGSGFDVVATYRSDPALAGRAASELGISVLRADVGREEEVEGVFKRLEAEGRAVGVLVNNVSSFPQGPVMSITPTEMRAAFESTYYASFHTIRRAVPGMRERGFGRIVNMGMAGLTELRGYSQIAVHASAKTALAVLTLSLARELSGTGITVNMVSPGMVDRPEWKDVVREEMKRKAPSHTLVPPIEVAKAVGYLVGQGDMNGLIVDVTERFEGL